jgi:L-alanine-DL-glutamate epimerase-like enolase superfamily enzyme
MKRKDFLQKSALAALAGITAPGIAGWHDLRFESGQNEKELEEHKISGVKFFNAEIKYPRNVGKNARRDNHGTGSSSGACQLRTDRGAMAWGLVEGSKNVYTKLAADLTGKKVGELFTINDGMVKEEHKCFEIAFFDLAGVILNKPVYKLLGGTNPIANKCYSGMIYFDDLDPEENPRGIDQLLRECEYDYNFGYRQFKVKIGRGNMWMETSKGDRRDAEVTREIANAFPDCEILVDGNDGYTPDRFIKYLDSIGSLKLFWVEEPFAETEEDCRKLREWMKQGQFRDTLYADGEASPDYDLMRELIDNDLIDVILYDIIGYGFAKWRRLYRELSNKKILASPHAWGSGIKTSYIAHLGSVYGKTPTIEGVTSFSESIDMTHYRPENGKIKPPDLPGFGMKLLIL